MQRCLALTVAFLFSLGATVFADGQTKQIRRDGPRSTVPKGSEHVEIRDTFALVTPFERWSLEDPLPTTGVVFDGKALTADQRRVNKSVASDGDDQWLFPVSWYEPYAGQPPSIKYVVVKYKAGKACNVMAEYLPQTYALPKADFAAHPDGKSFYCDMAIARQNGLMYLKQAISTGKDDGHDRYWVDFVVLYCIPDATALPTKRP